MEVAVRLYAEYSRFIGPVSIPEACRDHAECLGVAHPCKALELMDGPARGEISEGNGHILFLRKDELDLYHVRKWTSLILPTGCSVRASMTRTSCTRSMSRKWNASARARYTSVMSLAARWGLPPRQRRTGRLVLLLSMATHMTGIRSSRH